MFCILLLIGFFVEVLKIRKHLCIYFYVWDGNFLIVDYLLIFGILGFLQLVCIGGLQLLGFVKYAIMSALVYGTL